MIQLHYKDTDSFVLCMHAKDIIKDLKNFDHLFVFINWSGNHELFSNKSKK